MVALLPLYVEAKHPAFNYLDVGILLSMYQLGFILTAPVIGEKVGSLGRKRVIITGLIIMSIAVLIFAAAAFFTNDAAFYTISLIARFI